MDIQEVHQMDDTKLRKLLVQMRNAILQLSGSVEPLDVPTNLQVTPVAGGNKVRFTRSNGDGYKLVISKTAAITDGYTLQLGNTTEYNDNVGAGAERRWYWVIAYAANKPESTPVGPVSGVTLALGTSTVIPDPPPQNDPYRNPCFTGDVMVRMSDQLVRFDRMTHRVVVLLKNGERRYAKLIEHEYTGPVYKLPNMGGWVTPEHMMEAKPDSDVWVKACMKYSEMAIKHFTGTVYNLEIETSDPGERHYILRNGDVAHNIMNKSDT